jgi:hypothetical protein
MSFQSPKSIRKRIKQFDKLEVHEIRESEKAQRKGDLRSAIVHKDRAVDAQIQINKLKRLEQQRFVPITKIRSNF